MKKLLFIAIALLVCTLTSCEEDKTMQTTDGTLVRNCSISRMDFEGHRYIVYSKGFGKNAVGGITHDPDCPCSSDK